MLTSIVVPSRGGRDTLPRLLDSLDAQTDPNFEVIVVLDGNIDGSETYLNAQERRYPIRPIVFATNRGRASALNSGFGAAAGDVLVRCDDDMVVVPEFVATMASVRGKRQGLIGVSRDVFEPANRYGQVYGIDADADRRAFLKTLTTDVWRAWAALVAVPRDVYAQVGDYDVRYVGYGWEDVDWGYRAVQEGVAVRITDDVVAEHLKPARSAKERMSKALASGRARKRFESLHPAAQVHKTKRAFSVWNLAVDAVSLLLTPTTVGFFGSMVDALIKVLPKPVARKLVALHVEAAGR